MRCALKKTASDNSINILETGRKVLEKEANALLGVAHQLDEEFVKAVKEIAACKGRVVLVGLGKSGHVGQKIASTMASLGVPAFALHPTEALHGDFGQLMREDLLLAIAYSGQTKEVLSVVKKAKLFGLEVVSITGNIHSPLAQMSLAHLFVKITEEADLSGVAPTCSSTASLALGDALAVAASSLKNFKLKDFAQLHPGGVLGRSLSSVQEHMHSLSKLVVVTLSSSFQEILIAMMQVTY